MQKCYFTILLYSCESFLDENLRNAEESTGEERTRALSALSTHNISAGDRVMVEAETSSTSRKSPISEQVLKSMFNSTKDFFEDSLDDEAVQDSPLTINESVRRSSRLRRNTINLEGNDEANEEQANRAELDGNADNQEIDYEERDQTSLDNVDKVSEQDSEEEDSSK